MGGQPTLSTRYVSHINPSVMTPLHYNIVSSDSAMPDAKRYSSSLAELAMKHAHMIYLYNFILGM